MIRALIFDFDGTILDTEEPEFRAWQEMYREHGHELSFDLWATCIGTKEAAYNPYDHLESLLDGPLPRAEVRLRQHSRFMALIAEQTLLPGIREYLEEAERLNLKIGLASSSRHDWVEPHLERLGIRSFFQVIRCSEDVPLTKPHPALYQSALEALNARPEESVAFEDSPNGIRAARAAGLYCVVIPNPLTARLAVGEADTRLNSLNEISLAELLERIENRNGLATNEASS